MSSDMDYSETGELLIAETNDFMSRRKVSRSRQVYSFDKRTSFFFLGLSNAIKEAQLGTDLWLFIQHITGESMSLSQYLKSQPQDLKLISNRDLIVIKVASETSLPSSRPLSGLVRRQVLVHCQFSAHGYYRMWITFCFSGNGLVNLVLEVGYPCWAGGQLT